MRSPNILRRYLTAQVLTDFAEAGKEANWNDEIAQHTSEHASDSNRTILFSILICLFQKVEVLFTNTNIFSWPSFLTSALWMQSALFVRNEMCSVHAFPGASTLPCIGFCHAALKNLFQSTFFRYTVLAKQLVRASFVISKKLLIKFQVAVLSA